MQSEMNLLPILRYILRTLTTFLLELVTKGIFESKLPSSELFSFLDWGILGDEAEMPLVALHLTWTYCFASGRR